MLLPAHVSDPKRFQSPTLPHGCHRWYLAYSLSLRNLEVKMAERCIVVDHSTLHRWVIRLVPLLDKLFRWHKRTVGRISKSKVSGNICAVQ